MLFKWVYKYDKKSLGMHSYLSYKNLSRARSNDAYKKTYFRESAWKENPLVILATLKR